MEKIKILFNGVEYLIDRSELTSTINNLKSHLSTSMSGTGATIKFDGNTYNVSSTKLATERNKFTTHLGTIAGTDSKVTVGGVEYGLNSSKTRGAATELETVFGSLSGGDTPVEPPVVMKAAGLYETGTDTMTASWDELLADGTVHVDNGVLSTDYDYDNYVSCSSNALTGDLILPNNGSIMDIAESTFEGCSNLTGISIPNSVTSVAGWVFYNCESLTKANFTGTVDQWAQIEFSNETSNPTCYTKDLYINNELVTEINLTTANKISNFVFRNCQSVTSVTIPDSVTSIGYNAFDSCINLTSIAIPDSVTYTNQSICYGCSNLTSVTIGNSVTSIDSSAFNGCSSLTEIIIPDSVTFIDWDAFAGCDGITDVYYKGTETQWNSIEILSGNEPLTNATIHYNYQG